MNRFVCCWVHTQSFLEQGAHDVFHVADPDIQTPVQTFFFKGVCSHEIALFVELVLRVAPSNYLYCRWIEFRPDLLLAKLNKQIELVCGVTRWPSWMAGLSHNTKDLIPLRKLLTLTIHLMCKLPCCLRNKSTLNLTNLHKH